LTQDRKPRFFYGYIIVSVAFGIGMIGWGFFTTFGVFFNPLLDDFGWTRATISGARSIAFLITGFFGIIAGRLGDRFGPRLVLIGCGLFLGLAGLLMSQVNTIWQLYLFYGVMVGIGTSGIDVLLLSTIVRWFVKRRGMMSGVMKVGTGAGMMIMPLVASGLILSYGWRTSYLILGGAASVFIVLAAQFLRRDPSQKGLLPYGAGEVNADGLNAAAEAGFSLREAVRLRQFWMFCAMCLLTFFCADTIIVHIVPYGLELGISAANAAAVLATIGGASMVGRVIMGGAGDRVGSRLAIRICFPIIAIALFWLQFSQELWMLYLFACVYGFVHGGFFALLSPLVAELFGLSAHGVIFGVVFFSGAIGSSLGPVLVGYIFDVTSSYQLGFLVCALLAVSSFILALLLRPTSGKGLQPVSDT